MSYDTLLEELRGELSSLKASAGSSVKTLSTPRSGYFSLVTDGLEDQLTPEYLKDLTAVSYTHLDVYKRQEIRCSCQTIRCSISRISALL